MVEQRRSLKPTADIAASIQGTSRDPGSSSGQPSMLNSDNEIPMAVDDNCVGDANSMEVDEEGNGGKPKGCPMFRGWY